MLQPLFVIQSNILIHSYPALFWILDDGYINHSVKKNASKTVSSVPRRPKPRSMRDPSRKMLPLKRYLRRLSALRVEGVPGDRGDKTVAVIIADGGTTVAI